MKVSTFREKLKAKWIKFRNWIVGLLIAMGLIVMPTVYGGSKDFSWTNPTEYTDGTPLPISELQQIKIYCTATADGSQVPVFTVAAPATNFTASLDSGEYQCYATAVSVEGIESFASNSITFTVDPLIPNPPVLNP